MRGVVPFQVSGRAVPERNCLPEWVVAGIKGTAGTIELIGKDEVVLVIVETCTGLGARGGVKVDEVGHLEEDGGLARCVYVDVAVHAVVSCFVEVEEKDGAEDENIEETEYEQDEDADVEDATPGETVIMDAACLGVMEAVLVIDGIKEVVCGVVLVGDKTTTDGGESGFVIVLIEGSQAGGGGGGTGTVGIGR